MRKRYPPTLVALVTWTIMMTSHFIRFSSNMNNKSRSLNYAMAFSSQHGLKRRLPLVVTSSTTTTATTRRQHSFLGGPVSKQQRIVGAFSTRTFAETTTTTVEWPTDRVRKTFVDYFCQTKQHTFQPSSPCAPLNDPTLLFTNAGMNQFKPIFLGQADPNTNPLANLSRAANSQKCIRAGGKHNDLEDVGRDTYHHTFFEMLGSWSFGDYFQKEAIDWAWDLLTNVYGLEPSNLYATYFEGNDNVPADTVARDLWLQYLPPERVLACSAKDNFWEMGDTGPCGPCSEIHFDRIGNRDAASLVNADDPDVIEIWNLVFIQFNRDEQGTLSSLPLKHVDTGMGLERLVSILQDKTSNYDIDAFGPLFTKIAEYSQVGPYEGKLGPVEDASNKDTAYRAIADHARTLCFAIADGAVPSNMGRGYVLRRILRRATRYGQQILKAPPGFFSSLVPVVVETFGDTYPELKEQEATIREVIEEEEKSFSTMLDRGIKFFAELQEDLQDKGQKQVSGEKAFFLYDSLGFPIDLTELMAEEAGLTVDTDGFASAMEAQKQRSRDARSAAKTVGDGVPKLELMKLELMAEQTAWLTDQGIAPTDDSFKYKLDVELPATVLAVYGVDGFQQEGDSVKGGDYVGLVLDKSSFYAEAGGQEADTGTIAIVDPTTGDVTGKFEVVDVQTYAGFLLHVGRVVALDDDGGDLMMVGSVVNCQVDYERRRLVTPNHSMTHVLNAALRQVLGDAVDQRGSLCNDEKLRFDFSHKKAMTADELRATESICQQIVQQGQAVTEQVLPLAEAQELPGVRAVFGEVYPDPVRVITIGEETSIEFCGGTHVSNTAEAQAFVIVEETAVAKGIRRITAVTRDSAQEALEEGSKLQSSVATMEALSADTTADLDQQAGALRKELDAAFVSATVKADLRHKIEVIQKKALDVKKAALANQLNVVIAELETKVEAAVAAGESIMVANVAIGADGKLAQKVINAVKKVAPDNMAFLGVSEEDPGSGGKAMVFAMVPDSMVETIQADEWVRETLAGIGGRGGGKPNNAQGQVKECADVTVVEAAAKTFAETKIGAVVS